MNELTKYIDEQSWLEEWLSHTARYAGFSAYIDSDNEKVKLRQEFEEIISEGLEKSKIKHINETSLIVEMANAPSTLINLVRERYLKHPIIEAALRGKRGSCNFFEFLVENGIINTTEYYRAYKLAGTLAYRMQLNAITFKDILKDFKEHKAPKRNGGNDFPILESLIGDMAGLYMDFCKTLSKDTEKAQLLYEIADKRAWEKWKAPKIYKELCTAKIIGCSLQNFYAYNNHIDPNILTAFNSQKGKK